MFLLVSGRHVGAHPDGHQHGVPRCLWRPHTNLYKFGGKASPHILQKKNWRESLHSHLLSFVRFWTSSVQTVLIFILNGVTLKTSNNCGLGSDSLVILFSETFCVYIKSKNALLIETKLRKKINGFCAELWMIFPLPQFYAFSVSGIPTGGTQKRQKKFAGIGVWNQLWQKRQHGDVLTCK